MIPDEAVEAAAFRFAALAGYDWDKKWDTTADVEADVRADIRRQAEEILEAAAPHMLAEAWEAGYRAGNEDCTTAWDADRHGRPVKDEDTAANPYRSQP